MIAAHRAGRTARSLVLVTAALATAACDLGPVRDLPAVPAAATPNAAPPGYDRIRAYGNVIGASDAQTDSLGAAALARLRGAEAVDILALSGGGDGGDAGFDQGGAVAQFEHLAGLDVLFGQAHNGGVEFAGYPAEADYPMGVGVIDLGDLLNPGHEVGERRELRPLVVHR